MKIAYLSTFYPFRGGIAQFNARLLQSLSKYAEVVPFTFKRQYPSLLFPGKTQYVQPAENVEIVNSYPVLDTINPITYFTTARKIKNLNPDITITKYWMPFFAPSLGTVLMQLKSVSFNISILDNISPHEKFPFSNFWNKFFLKQNHSFVVMSEAVLKELLKLVPKANYTIVPHPLYDNFGKKIDRKKALEILGLPEDKKILLFFGLIREYKGLDLLLETISLLPNEFLLVIAGEPYVSFDQYDKLIQNLNLEDKVRKFVRYIPDSEVPIFFSAADVCVLPYKTATQSGIVGIAYHFDLPVIATRVGGLHEMIEPYRSGIVVDKAEPNQLASAILSFFQSPIDLFKIGIEKYKSLANWDYLASKIIEEYNYFLAKK